MPQNRLSGGPKAFGRADFERLPDTIKAKSGPEGPFPALRATSSIECHPQEAGRTSTSLTPRAGSMTMSCRCLKMSSRTVVGNDRRLPPDFTFWWAGRSSHLFKSFTLRRAGTRSRTVEDFTSKPGPHPEPPKQPGTLRASSRNLKYCIVPWAATRYCEYFQVS